MYQGKVVLLVTVEQPFFVNIIYLDQSRYTFCFEIMLKKDIIDSVSEELSMQKQDISVAADVILDTISGALSADRRVELRGFGSFSVRSRKPRTTKNPRTGQVMNIPERSTLHFTMSKSLKQALICETE